MVRDPAMAYGGWRLASVVGACVGNGTDLPSAPETVADTWDWLRREDPVPHERATEIGLDAVKEERLLAAWREHTASCQGGS